MTVDCAVYAWNAQELSWEVLDETAKLVIVHHEEKEQSLYRLAVYSVDFRVRTLFLWTCLIVFPISWFVYLLFRKIFSTISNDDTDNEKSWNFHWKFTVFIEFVGEKCQYSDGAQTTRMFSIRGQIFTSFRLWMKFRGKLHYFSILKHEYS